MINNERQGEKVSQRSLPDKIGLFAEQQGKFIPVSKMSRTGGFVKAGKTDAEVQKQEIARDKRNTGTI
jgi:hypothetical protein